MAAFDACVRWVLEGVMKLWCEVDLTPLAIDPRTCNDAIVESGAMREAIGVGRRRARLAVANRLAGIRVIPGLAKLEACGHEGMPGLLRGAEGVSTKNRDAEIIGAGALSDVVRLVGTSEQRESIQI